MFLHASLQHKMSLWTGLMCCSLKCKPAYSRSRREGMCAGRLCKHQSEAGTLWMRRADWGNTLTFKGTVHPKNQETHIFLFTYRFICWCCFGDISWTDVPSLEYNGSILYLWQTLHLKNSQQLLLREITSWLLNIMLVWLTTKLWLPTPQLFLFCMSH